MGSSADPERRLRELEEQNEALRAEVESLRRTERRWVTLMRRSPFGIAVYRPDGSVQAGNVALRRIYELTSEEAALAVAQYNIREDPQLEAQGLAEPIRRAFAGVASPLPLVAYDLVTPIEGRRIRRWLEGIVFPVLDASGDLQEVVSIQADVSELKRAEAALRESQRRLRTVVDNANVVLWAIDEDGIFTLSEGKGLEALGLRPGEVVGRSLFEIYAENRRILELARRALDGEAVSSVVLVGDLAYESWYLPHLDEDGRPRGALGVAIDVSERYHAEEAQRKLDSKIQHAQKLESLGVLAGGIAHDFNNLLMGVLGNADLAMRRLPAESPGQEYLEKISLAARRAAELTNQMLAYSGRGRFIVEPLDLNRIVREMDHFLHTVISKKVDLRFDLTGDLPAVEVDGSQIRQVVMNLITNASEAIGDETGTIRVRTELRDVDDAALQRCQVAEDVVPGRFVALEVTDTGCGMDAATQNLIFDPFFTTKFTGRGLGLAAVLGIVRGHGAALSVVSRPGRGTTFTVLLPVSCEKAVADGEIGSGEVGRHEAGATVLVADDEPVVREVARAMLESMGLVVLTAADGQEAVEVFQDRVEEISLVVLDVTMPRLDGEEACRRLREIHPETPVVLSSGYSEQDATERFADLKFSGFLQKPYTTTALARAVRLALDS